MSKSFWIKVLELAEMPERVRELYRKVQAPDGQIDNVLHIHSLRPHTLEAHMALYKATLHHRSNQLPTWLLECIGVYVSRLNRCDYCDRHHSAGLQRLLNDENRFKAYSQALSQAQPAEPFDAGQQLMLAYVRKLTLHPITVAAADVQALRDAGYDDGEILEINQVAAYFAYANRSVMGLGVDTQGEQLGYSPPDSESLNDWQHQ